MFLWSDSKKKIMDRVCFLLRTKSCVPGSDLKVLALMVWQLALILTMFGEAGFGGLCFKSDVVSSCLLVQLNNADAALVS